ncbi:MAG: phospho-N-acetylmuramoyl-pentapeptide-transferase [Fuerstiella sp.]
MILWLLQHFGYLLEQLSSRTTGDSRVFLTARIAAASLTAFLVTLLWGPVAIGWLKKRFRERIASNSETLNKLHANKQETPTMGGLFVMSAVLISTVLWGDLDTRFVQVGILVVVLMTIIGAWDDWVKQRTSRLGLSVRQKFAAQLVVGCIAGFALFGELRQQPFGTELVWPIGNVSVALGGFFIAWSALVVVATANGVNLTDGLDGLAAGCTITTASAFAALAYLCGHSVISEYLGIPHIQNSGELAVMLGALVGAMLGFLWFNCYPAQLFMGDAGSLPIGGLLAVCALATRQEILLVLIGGVFVFETLSVIVQVACFRITGKRPLRCSPLHNHFVFKGDHEMKIVVRFWICSVLLAILGIASLKLR